MSLPSWTALMIRVLIFVTLARFFSSVIRVLQSLLFASDIKKYKHDSESWALVTGSSEGIGFDLARELCRNGFHVVIHGRNEDKLNLAVSSLRREFPNQKSRPLVWDAAKRFQDPAINPFAQYEGHRFTILINNVGVGHDPTKDFSSFTSQTHAEIDQILDVNIRFTTHLTHLFLPILAANSTPTKPCLIINASSLAQIGLPWISVYSATKSYITTFSRALNTELKGEGVNVDVIASVIGDTDTPGHRIGTSLFTPSSAAMAKSILGGAGRHYAVNVPYMAHKLQQWVCDVQPFWLLQKGLVANIRPKVKKRS